ncbi:MAG: hypothetical protein JWQ87_3135 [Candidatus Sulfotelmatobacter sp.]|nr:hypothetical protein [Candidatus Sulfotelmatobacter sp.]
MRSQSILLTLGFALILSALGCSRKAASPDNANTASNTSNTNTAADANSSNQQNNNQQNQAPAPRPPLVVPSGTTVTIRLGSALGSKLSTSGQRFTGTVARDVVIDNAVAIPRGSRVSGTVVDAKPLGRFAGGALLEIKLDSIDVNGSEMPVQASARSYSEKGKGKRTGLMAGGGAALGGIVGGIAGGGKGAAIGLLAGGGAGGAGAAFTGNKEIILPAESAVAFELRRPVEIRQ